MRWRSAWLAFRLSSVPLALVKFRDISKLWELRELFIGLFGLLTSRYRLHLSSLTPPLYFRLSRPLPHPYHTHLTLLTSLYLPLDSWPPFVTSRLQSSLPISCSWPLSLPFPMRFPSHTALHGLGPPTGRPTECSRSCEAVCAVSNLAMDHISSYWALCDVTVLCCTNGLCCAVPCRADAVFLPYLAAPYRVAQRWAEESPALLCPGLPCDVREDATFPCRALALACPALPWLALPCLALPCPALPCAALTCPVPALPIALSWHFLPCPSPALPCPAVRCGAVQCPEHTLGLELTFCSSCLGDQRSGSLSQVSFFEGFRWRVHALPQALHFHNASPVLSVTGQRGRVILLTEVLQLHRHSFAVGLETSGRAQTNVKCNLCQKCPGFIMARLQAVICRSVYETATTCLAKSGSSWCHTSRFVIP